MITPSRPRDCSWVPSYFEQITVADFICSSDPTPEYNCIAHAAGKDDAPWWPLGVAPYHWPEGLPAQPPGEETAENFIKAFESEKYELCADGEIEAGFEKVAIYLNQNQKPTHAARSLPSGVWTSKLGDEEDIEHKTLEAVGGQWYGTAAVFLRRKIQ